MTLQRYCKKLRTDGKITNVGFASPRAVFTQEQEDLLVDYILKAAKIYHGLTPSEIRNLAYKFAEANDIKCPDSWSANGVAGVDWFSKFMKRNSSLSLRTPEATSLSRATSFNRTNVDKFFDNLSEVLDRYKFESHDIYNCDETGVTTVQRPDRIVAEKGVKQVGAMTSAERGTLVTMCLAVNASGNAIPPMLVFPRVNFREHFITNGPTGCCGSANPSGWMKETDFLKFMEHFVKHTRCSKEHPVLLLLDNHASHISLAIIDFCRDNGVVLVSFPPHCSHKLQPLDRSVYGPLKKYVNRECDGWMKSHPGKTMTIYDIPAILKEALPHACTPINIQKGFQVSGIWPFNRDVFGDDEFLPGYVTDRPAPLQDDQPVPHDDQQPDGQPGSQPDALPDEEPNDQSNVLQDQQAGAQLDSQPDIPEDQTGMPSDRQSDDQMNRSPMLHKEQNDQIQTDNPTPGPSSAGLPAGVVKSPEMLRPFRKASPRKTNRGSRKRCQTAILTSTPVKQRLLDEAKQQKSKPKKTTGATKGSSVKNGKGKSAKTGKGKGKQPHRKQDQDWKCIICSDWYSNSLPGEEWVECMVCKDWAHAECTDGRPDYLCDMCSQKLMEGSDSD